MLTFVFRFYQFTMLHGHGDDIHNCRQTVKSNFSSNIYGATDLSGLQHHLASRMDCLSRYPEPEPLMLEAKWAEAYGLQPEEVCVTNGATEAIYLIAQAFRGARSNVWQPTFNEYADACRMHGHRVKSVFSADAIDADADLVWLCNPNNPTGEVRSRHKISELIEAYPSVCFVIDRSYEPFTSESLFSVTEAVATSRVLLLHSATKRYAVPGIRLGCVTASKALLQRIRTQRMPWSVNAPAIEAGMYFLATNPPLQPSVEALLAETQRLRDAIATLKIMELWPTDTHFFLARLRIGKAAILKKYLLEKHGILIRDASNFEGLDDTFIRIATQTPEDNNRLIQALNEWKHFIFS